MSGFRKDCWINLFDRHRAELDLSSVDLDGSHASAKRGGVNGEYQGRKKPIASNSSYLSDSQVILLTMAELVNGYHKDQYNLELQYNAVFGTLEEIDIFMPGLFMSTELGFDAEDLRKLCGLKGINANNCFKKGNGRTKGTNISTWFCTVKGMP